MDARARAVPGARADATRKKGAPPRPRGCRRPPAARGRLLQGREPVVVEADPRRQLGRLPGGGLGQPEHGDAARPGRCGQLLHGRPARTHPDRVDDRDQVGSGAGLGSGLGRTAAGGRPGAAVGSRLWGGEAVHAQDGWAARTRRSSGAWKAASSQTIERASARARSGGPGEGEHAGAAERDGHRGVRQPGGAADEVPGGLQELGVVPASGPRAVSRRIGRPAGRAAPALHGEEVGVGQAALPQPVGPVDRRPQPGQVGMEVLGGRRTGGGQLSARAATRPRWSR